MFARIDPAIGDVANNVCYASEMTPEQWALEQELAGALAADGDDSRGVGPAALGYLERLRGEPQRSFHFGIRLFDRDDFDATLDRIRAAEHEPELAGRVELINVYHPDEPGAYAKGMIQAFVRTDVVAAGSAGVRPARRAPVASAAPVASKERTWKRKRSTTSERACAGSRTSPRSSG